MLRSTHKLVYFLSNKKFLLKNGRRRHFCSGKQSEIQTISSQLMESFKQVEEEGLVMPFFKKSLLYHDRNAMQDSFGVYSYLQLYTRAKSLSMQVSNICDSASSSNVICIFPNNVLATVSQWACWMSGQVPVPFNPEFSWRSLEYFIETLQPRALITNPMSESLIKYIAEKCDIAYIVLDHTFMRCESVSLDALKKKWFILGKASLLCDGLHNDYYTNSLATMFEYSHAFTTKPTSWKISHKFINDQLNAIHEKFKGNKFNVLYQFVSVNSMCEMFTLSSGRKVVTFDCCNTQNAWSTILNTSDLSKSQKNVFASLPKIYTLILIEFERNFAGSDVLAKIQNYLQSYFQFVVYCNEVNDSVTNITNRWKDLTGTQLYVICSNNGGGAMQEQSRPDIPSDNIMN